MFEALETSNLKHKKDLAASAVVGCAIGILACFGDEYPATVCEANVQRLRLVIAAYEEANESYSLHLFGDPLIPSSAYASRSPQGNGLSEPIAAA